MTIIEEMLKKLKAHDRRLGHLEKIDKPIRAGIIMTTDIAQSISAETYTVVNYNTIYDPFGILTGDAVIPKFPYWLEIMMIARTEDTVWKNRDEWEIAVMRDGSFDSAIAAMIFQGPITANALVNGTTLTFALEDEEIEFAVWSTVATALSGDPKENRVSIFIS